MRKLKINFILFALPVCAALLACVCNALQSAKINPATASIPPAAPMASDDAMIARASGDETAARDYFNRAQKLTPAIFRQIAFQYWKSPAKTEFADAGMRS